MPLAAAPLVQLERFVAGDTRTTAAGVVVGIALVAAVAPDASWAWAIIVIVAAMGLVRRRALRPLREGDARRAVAHIALGSWGVAIGVVVIVPSFLPVLIVTMAIPAVIAAMILPGRDVAAVAVALVVVTLACGALGMWTEGVDLEEQIGEQLRNLVVVGYLAGQMVPLVQVVWQTSHLQRIALRESNALNAELRRSQGELAASRRRLVEAADAERVRVERDLHDGAQQTLVSTLLQLRVAARGVERGQPVDAARLDELARQLEGGIDELRTLAHGIFPPLLDARGLHEAVRSMAKAATIEVVVDGPDPGRLAPSQETAFYFCVSEALQNVTKHAGTGAAATITFAVDGRAPHELRITVADDGVGADPAAIRTGNGMTNMRDRMGAIGGSARFDRAAGAGCRVLLIAPVAHVAPDPAASASEARSGAVVS